MATDKNSRMFDIRIPGNMPLPPSEGANYFHFSFAGDEMQLLVGTVNLLRLHEARTQQDHSVIVPDITHRFLLSPLGFNALKEQLASIDQKYAAVQKLRQTGKPSRS